MRFNVLYIVNFAHMNKIFGMEPTYKLFHFIHWNEPKKNAAALQQLKLINAINENLTSKKWIFAIYTR